MVIVGGDDLRTPVAESEQYYHALKLRRIPTQLVIIPGANHGISQRPSHLLAQVANTVAWFRRHAPTAAK
jgi:acylaminoacyl-peptidase